VHGKQNKTIRASSGSRVIGCPFIAWCAMLHYLPICYLKLGTKTDCSREISMCNTKRKKRRNKEKREGKTNYFWANNNAYIVRHASVHTLRALDCIVAEGGGNNLLRNVDNCLSVDTPQCPSRHFAESQPTHRSVPVDISQGPSRNTAVSQSKYRGVPVDTPQCPNVKEMLNNITHVVTHPKSVFEGEGLVV